MKPSKEHNDCHNPEFSTPKNTNNHSHNPKCQIPTNKKPYLSNFPFQPYSATSFPLRSQFQNLTPKMTESVILNDNKQVSTNFNNACNIYKQRQQMTSSIIIDNKNGAKNHRTRQFSPYKPIQTQIKVENLLQPEISNRIHLKFCNSNYIPNQINTPTTLSSQVIVNQILQFQTINNPKSKTIFSQKIMTQTSQATQLKKKASLCIIPVKQKFVEPRTPKVGNLQKNEKFSASQFYKNKTPTEGQNFNEKCENKQGKFVEAMKLFQRKLSMTYQAYNCIKIQDFKIIKQIGKGKFGEVYLAIHRNTGWIYAIKSISKSKIKEFKMEKQVIQQIKIQGFCDNANIVQLYAYFDDELHVYLVLQYVNQGTLFDKIHTSPRMAENQVSQIIKQTTFALKYLHDRNIAHRDLKPQNIVISCGVVKLCDFGWSAYMKGGRKTYCGTFAYASPQILEQKIYDTSVDLWCLGIMTYQLIFGKVPFESQQRKLTIKRILNVDNQQVIFPFKIGDDCKSFILKLLKKNPEQRPKAHKLLNHDFLMRST